MEDVEGIVERVGGFPVIVRPSYVLSGAAMRVARALPELREYLRRATDVSPEHPVVVSAFEEQARELEYDAVAADGVILHWAISEHVENAGVHSGDATLALPPQQLYLETLTRARKIGITLAKALRVTGPFNVQLLARNNDLKVIECNLRASRSFPFVSKVLGTNFITEATCLMLGTPPRERVKNPLELDHVGVKAAQFSFRRLAGTDPVLGVEMLSVGEVGCIGDTFDEALLKAMLSTGFRLPSRGVLLSLGPIADKYKFTEEAKLLAARGLTLFATSGTAVVLREQGLECQVLGKGGRESWWPGQKENTSAAPDAVSRMRAGDIDLVINIPRDYDEQGRPDGFLIRRAATDLEIPLLTDLALARKLVRALCRCERSALKPVSLSEYFDESRSVH